MVLKFLSVTWTILIVALNEKFVAIEIVPKLEMRLIVTEDLEKDDYEINGEYRS